MSQIISSPFQYFADPNLGRPLFNASVYIGTVDQDPEISPIQAQHLQEDGTEVPVAQPLTTGAGGIIMIGGSPATITVAEQSYSLRVRDSLGAEVYYLQDAVGAAAVDPNIYVQKAGDTMTGRLDFVDAQGDLRLQTIDDVGFNGIRVFDLEGVEPLLQIFTDGDDSRFLVKSSGNIGFTNAQQTTGDYRFIIQSDDGVKRHAVLGTPWPPQVSTEGYDHLQLYFLRDAETATPFMVCETGAITQFWVGPDGGTVMTGAAEVRNFDDDGSGGWGIYSQGDATLDSILVITAGLNILEGGAGNEVWYSGAIKFQTNATTASPGTINEFEMTSGGDLKIPGLAGTGTRDVQVQADGTLIAV